MSEHLPGPRATAAPAVERAEPAAGHRACPGTAAGAGECWCTRAPGFILTERDMLAAGSSCWDKENALENCLQTTVLLWEAGCAPGLSTQPGSTGWCCSPLPHPTDLPAGQAGSLTIPRRLASPPEPSEHQLKNQVWCCQGSEGVRGWLGREVSMVLGSTQPGEKTQQSLAEGRGSRRATQTLLILNDTAAERCRGAEEPSRRLLEGQGAGLQPPGLPVPGKGCHVEG